MNVIDLHSNLLKQGIEGAQKPVTNLKAYMVDKKIVSGDFSRKPQFEGESISRWYRYSEVDQIDIVWCSDIGRGWSAYDAKHDRTTKEYDSRSELTKDLDNGTIEWL